MVVGVSCKGTRVSSRVWIKCVAREEHVRLKRRKPYGCAFRRQHDIAGLINPLTFPVNERAGTTITFGRVFNEV